jgi:uncharacterized membrane protein
MLDSLEPYHEWFVLIHILSAIVALGANVGYVFWLDFVDRNRSHLDFTIGGIERMDRIVTGPAYLVLLLSGIVLILIEAFPITEFWLLAGIVLYFVSGLTSFLVLTPSLRNQMALAGAGDLDGSAYRAARTRSWVTAWVVVAIVTVVAGLMVLKPVL